MNYTIRKAEPRDIARLVELCHHHADYEQAAYSPEGKAEPLHQALFGVVPRLHCMVVEVANTVQGYFSFTFDYSTWDACQFLYLDCLYLEPEIRGGGIGVQIFDHLKAIARHEGCVNIQWQTPVFNERAISFYNRLGGVSKDKVRYSLVP